MDKSSEFLVVLRCPKCRAYLGRRNFVASTAQRELLKCKRCNDFVEPIEANN